MGVGWGDGVAHSGRVPQRTGRTVRMRGSVQLRSRVRLCVCVCVKGGGGGGNEYDGDDTILDSRQGGATTGRRPRPRKHMYTRGARGRLGGALTRMPPSGPWRGGAPWAGA